jgi:hypothetical protein
MIITIYAILPKDLTDRRFYIGSTEGNFETKLKNIKLKLNKKLFHGIHYEIQQAGGFDYYDFIEMAKIKIDSKDDIYEVTQYYETFVNDFYDSIDKLT